MDEAGLGQAAQVVQRIQIRHLTRYSYPGPVTLGPQTLRLKPRSEPGQSLLEFDLRISPQPAGRGELLELDGSLATQLWFTGQHQVLELEARSVVELKREDPFAFIVTEPRFLSLPARYPGILDAALQVYRLRPDLSVDVNTLSQDVLKSVNFSSTAFLPALCQRLHSQLRRIHREDGEPWAPGLTLSKGEGACRDLAWLFVDAARAVGLAARFVSGYAFTGDGTDLHELHAWAEAYLPGGGWRAFDPSTGLAVTDGHVAVAAGSHFDLAAPVSGTFGGESLAALESQVEIALA